MSRSWTANDDPTGKPTWANTSVVYGVNRTEAKLYGKSVSPGWVNVTPMTGYVSAVTITNAGTGYANTDTFVIANGTSNGTGTMVAFDLANATGSLVIASTVNATANGVDLTTTLANGDVIFYYSNATNKVGRVVNKVVNSTFLNVTVAFSHTNAIGVNYGRAGVISSVGFTGGVFASKTANVVVTTAAGVGGVLTIGAYSGRIDRVGIENLVAISQMAGDASDDTLFPDS